MIEIKDLHKSYKMGTNSLHVLKGINFEVSEGEMVAIMGSSGSGKSTLLNILGILDEADKGSYHLDETLIKNLNEKVAAKYRNKFLGFVFQSFNLINYKSALDNVALPLYYQGVKRNVRMEKALHYLDKVGLADWASHLPNELSGGQKQRISIARAILKDSPILILDEATSAVDSRTEQIIQDQIQLLSKTRTCIIIAHRLSTIQHADQIILLQDGSIKEHGNHDKLMKEEGMYAKMFRMQSR